MQNNIVFPPAYFQRPMKRDSVTSVIDDFQQLMPGVPIYAAQQIQEMLPNKLFVGGFPPETTEAELEAIFANSGNVKEVRIVKNPDFTHKGFGFITFETIEEADRARHMPSESLVLHGKVIKVGLAFRKQNVALRPEDYLVASPDGSIQKSKGFNYVYAVPAPYTFMGIPQPSAFVCPASSSSRSTSFNRDNWSTGQITPTSGPNSSNSLSQLLPQAPPTTPVSPAVYPGGQYYFNMPSTPVAVATLNSLHSGQSHPFLSPTGSEGMHYPVDNNYNYVNLLHSPFPNAYSGQQPNVNMLSGVPLRKETNSRDGQQKGNVAANKFKEKHNKKQGTSKHPITPPSTPRNK